MRYISPKSAWRLINNDFPGTESTYKGLTVKRKPIQPLFNSGRHASYVIEGKGGEEGGVSTIAVSVRIVCRFLTSKGYYYLQSTKKDFRLLGCAKKIKVCSKNEMTTY